MFNKLIEQIFESAKKDFKQASEEIRFFVDRISVKDFKIL